MILFDETWLAKLEELRASGVDPYPNGLVVTHTSGQVRERWGGIETGTIAEDGAGVAVGGRVIFRNRMGRAMFLRIADRDGLIQIYLRRDEVGDETFAICRGLDIGDFIWAEGQVMKTRTGELSVQASRARLAAKILNSFPDRWHGVVDVETRSRQRYVDLFMNEETRETFRRRFEIIRYIRDFFHERDFLEVETPILQPIPGGAIARPFVTHHNALDIDLFMRIAPELYLKRLVVGGFERVFEINRSFRNEGISVKHNPEFTMLEFYQAWATHDDLMALTETLISGLVQRICGRLQIPFGELTLDFTPPFRRADMDALIAEATGIDRADLERPDRMEAWWRAHHQLEEGVALPTTRGGWWEWLFDEHVEQTLIDPVFVTGFPTEISPLSRRNDADPSRVDRFELVAATWELANAFSELNDPVDQAARFASQASARDAGDEESMYFDQDYIRALSYGMPPTAGEGIGIDRLVMLLTNKASIREVILFPTLRPEGSGP
ncbi:MAG TPA: lysine--tRNA ligase [Deltaproteobacteria bacterium]|nr:lysine--tRNA ligase [Deltaproteobacteria bacterium]